jgi:Xaa-Pro aminopeptidase
VFAARRQQLLDSLGPNAVAIFVGGRLATRSADTEYPFRQDSDFWYLTGFDHPDAIAVLSTRPGPAFTLFVQPRDRAAETWTGYRPGVEGAVADYAADEAHPRESFLEKLPALVRGADRIYHTLGRDPAIDARIVSLQDEIRRQSRGGVLPAESIVDPRLLVHEMRLRKSSEEIALMQHAAGISLEAHHAAARLAQPGRFEYELEAALGQVFRARGGSGPAYGTIVGAGANATVLHYVDNDRVAADGDLVLVDAGCEIDGYTADITRTFPVNGRFSPAQRAVYEVVLAAQLAAIDVCRPGRLFQESHDVAVRTLVEGFLRLGLLHGEVDALIAEEAYKRVYMHRTSHWLGLDVHDVGRYVVGDAWRPLEPGMVLTIEPGCYVAVDDDESPAAYRGIGVRIEDDVLITETGILNLTRDIPKSIEALEAWVQGA